MQVALVAGRAASRWATSTSTTPLSTSRSHPSSISLTHASANLHRHLSTTRALLQEAEAPAPPSSSSMAAYMAQMQQHKQQQQQQQEQPNPTASTQPSSSLGIRSIFGPTKSPPPSSSLQTSPRNYLSQPWAARPSSVRSVPGSRTKNVGIIDDTIDELGLKDLASRPDANDFSNDLAGGRLGPRPIDIKYRLRPVIGRTVDLKNNIDVATGLKMLNSKVTHNKVKLDFNKQKFHERPGLMRKRQKSERWRRRFKQGFKATCDRVRELAKQGW